MFEVVAVGPDNITDAVAQPDPERLSMTELLICFPTRIGLTVDGVEGIRLTDAPVLGVIGAVAEALRKLRDGALSSEIVDFYGEFALMLCERDGMIRCEETFGGGECSVDASQFRAAMAEWSHAMFDRIDERFPAVRNNPNYGTLKQQVVDAYGVR